MSKRAHFFQHVPFEGLGSMESWLVEQGYQIGCTRWHAGDGLPKLEDIDLLIVMGGPMSVNDERQHPWLVEEQAFLREAIDAGKAVLGVCLGAQLIAKCMGGEVLLNPAREIGWFPLQAVPTADTSLFSFPSEFTAFHWHGETFTLPPGAVHTARSEACLHQAFQLGPKVIGLQFHLETTPESAAALMEHCRDELGDGLFVQSENEMRTPPSERYRTIHSLMAEILGYLTRQP